jgi:hypothetical protein
MVFELKCNDVARIAFMLAWRSGQLVPILQMRLSAWEQDAAMLVMWNTEGHDMIFRALFWIGLVSLLTPREPDLGLGRPDAGATHLSPTTIQSAFSQTGQDCGFACGGGLLSVFHLNINGKVAAGLADVKAQIEQDQSARAARVKAI